MEKIYALTSTTYHSEGHGEPSIAHTILNDDGVWEKGKEYPLFRNRDDAEKFRQGLEYNWDINVTELELK